MLRLLLLLLLLRMWLGCMFIRRVRENITE